MSNISPVLADYFIIAKALQELGGSATLTQLVAKLQLSRLLVHRRLRTGSTSQGNGYFHCDATMPHVPATWKLGADGRALLEKGFPVSSGKTEELPQFFPGGPKTEE
jgi:hypothetical protein